MGLKIPFLTKLRIRSVGKLFTGLTLLASLVIITMVIVIITNIIYFGSRHLSLQFFTTAPSQGMMGGGIFPAIFGTVALVILMTIVVIPLGVMTAIYLTEYAPQGSVTVSLVRLGLHNLAGVPSIVFGLFGVGFFIQFVGRNIDRTFNSGNLLFGQPAIIWAALTLALLTLPTVVVATEEALRSVPSAHREVAYSLGATRWQVVRRVVLPQSIRGIMTGAILAVSRGSGEVTPVMFTGAAYYLPFLPTRLNDQFMELGYHIYVMATQSPDIERTKPILYSTVLVLLILTFVLNFFATLIRAQARYRLRVGR